MDEKTFACFSKGMMILWEAYLEKRGMKAIGSRVVLVDDPKEKAPQKEEAS